MDAQAATIAVTRRTDPMTGKRTRARRLSAVAVFAFALVSGGVRADVVTEWNVIAFDTFKAANIGGNPLIRGLTIMHVAMSDAVNTVQTLTLSTAEHSAESRASADAAAVPRAYVL